MLTSGAALGDGSPALVGPERGSGARRLRPSSARVEDPRGGDELNARDFGAVGDGLADDSAALQRAIDAAQMQNRRLVLPGGEYLVNTSLSVAPTAGPGAGAALNLVGEGRGKSLIVAGRPMNAVFNFSACCGAVPKHSSNEHTMANLGIDAHGLANYSVLAPAITRSQFLSLHVSSALIAGLSLGYGWCNRIELCEFHSNGMGVHIYNAGNNVDIIDSIFEANVGPGMYLLRIIYIYICTAE